jgi:uncharacterized protein (TIGR02145 family)
LPEGLVPLPLLGFGAKPQQFLIIFFKGKEMKHLAYIILCFVMLCNVHLVNAQGDVKIGKQTWMSKNLDVSTFRNGDTIPEAKTKKEWKKADREKTPAFCYYEFDEENGKKYGKMYNWYAVNDPRGLAPKGYHVPNNEEWNKLGESLGGLEKAGKKLKSKEGWSPVEDGSGKTIQGNGDNSSSFSALPSGACKENGAFGYAKFATAWWTSEEASPKHAWLWTVIASQDVLIKGKGDDEKNCGFPVRCVKD